MDEKDIKKTKQDLREVRKKASDKDYSISVLKRIGILTSSGELAEQYENLCTPSRQV